MTMLTIEKVERTKGKPKYAQIYIKSPQLLEQAKEILGDMSYSEFIYQCTKALVEGKIKMK